MDLSSLQTLCEQLVGCPFWTNNNLAVQQATNDKVSRVMFVDGSGVSETAKSAGKETTLLMGVMWKQLRSQIITTSIQEVSSETLTNKQAHPF